MIALALIVAPLWYYGCTAAAWGETFAGLFLFQLAVMGHYDRQLLWHFSTSQKLGPTVMRSASIGFAECVRPGGKPTPEHCLHLYKYSGMYRNRDGRMHYIINS